MKNRLILIGIFVLVINQFIGLHYWNNELLVRGGLNNSGEFSVGANNSSFITHVGDELYVGSRGQVLLRVTLDLQSTSAVSVGTYGIEDPYFEYKDFIVNPGDMQEEIFTADKVCRSCLVILQFKIELENSAGNASGIWYAEVIKMSVMISISYIIPAIGVFSLFIMIRKSAED